MIYLIAERCETTAFELNTAIQHGQDRRLIQKDFYSPDVDFERYRITKFKQVCDLPIY